MHFGAGSIGRRTRPRQDMLHAACVHISKQPAIFPMEQEAGALYTPAILLCPVIATNVDCAIDEYANKVPSLPQSGLYRATAAFKRLMSLQLEAVTGKVYRRPGSPV